ncbi:hypothetical protein NEOLEDRAFT_1066643 [Neolentinus lepideus HHB14362 ss-1]|uniref:Uncharacterized protein n=1 Tax=Neolentinus lepideus HHB14362 ss-1 TaxID=1314782 RepID=A0A165S493_9AGAM|nr:hypothetical protein NEOLEDRAFT_1066643 [Neolentinus lepideus HHB14362 ss-1]
MHRNVFKTRIHADSNQSSRASRLFRTTPVVCLPSTSACAFRHLGTRKHGGAASIPDSEPQEASAATSKSRGGRKPAPIISTLIPECLSPSDFIPLDGRTAVFLRASTLRSPTISKKDPTSLSYTNSSRRRVPFPAGTKGFLYWHYTPGNPALTGHIRFRITGSPNPAQFAQGEDLRLPDGHLWHIPLLRIASTQYKSLQTLLLADNIVTEYMLREAENIHDTSGSRPTTKSPVIWRFNQTFPTLIETRVLSVWVLGYSQCLRFKLLYPFRTLNPRTAPVLACKGCACLLRFERSDLPEHRGTRTVVLRIVKISELIKTGELGLHVQSPQPKEGGLLMTRATHGISFFGERPWIPWSINVDDPKVQAKRTQEALKLLFDNEEHAKTVHKQNTSTPSY